MATLGLTEDQHAAVGKLIVDSGIIVRRPVAPRPKRGTTGGDVLRVMAVDDGYPIYQPREIRKCAIFSADFQDETTTVQMFGNDLSGSIELTVDGTTYNIHCQASNDELRNTLGFSSRYCRATAFPGTWEFAWGGGVAAPVVTARPRSQFFGGLLVTNELWRSDTEDGTNPVLVDVIDSIPFIEGQVKRGALSIASPYGDGYFVAQYWHCPGFSFGAR